MTTDQDAISLKNDLKKCTFQTLETYSNVHRGSGHKSIITTHLFEKARLIVLDYLNLSGSGFSVVFCSPISAHEILKRLKGKNYSVVSSDDIGLSLGVRAIVAKKNSFPGGAPSLTGGGTARLVSGNWVVWSFLPDKYEAGTPSIVNIITFARALQLVQKYGSELLEKTNDYNEDVKDLLYNDHLVEVSGQILLDKLRDTIIGRNLTVPTSAGNTSFINFDSSASTPSLEPIAEAFTRCWNLSDKNQKEIVQEVREICFGFFGAPFSKYDIIFTANTTESINLVANELINKNGGETVVLSTMLEHSSNDLPWRKVSKESPIRLSVDNDGIINSEELEMQLKSYNYDKKYGSKRIRIVAVSGASNVLGICNNLKQISEITHRYGAELLVDAAQLVAHRGINMEADGIDYLAVSAHKIYAPFGCGILISGKGLLNYSKNEIISLGEENVSGIAALGKSLSLFSRVGMDIVEEDERQLTSYALNALSKVPGIKVYGVKTTDNKNFNNKLGVIVFELKRIMADGIAKKLSIDSGIGVRFGCHCAHIIIKHLLNIGPGLEKFQRLVVTMIPKVNLPGLTRVSFGIENTREDIDNLVVALENIVNKSKLGKRKSRKEVESGIKEMITNAENRIYGL